MTRNIVKRISMLGIFVGIFLLQIQVPVLADETTNQDDNYKWHAYMPYFDETHNAYEYKEYSSGETSSKKEYKIDKKDYNLINYEKNPLILTWEDGNELLGYRPDDLTFIGYIDKNKFENEGVIEVFDIRNDSIPYNEFDILAYFVKVIDINFYDEDYRTLLYSEKVYLNKSVNYKAPSKKSKKFVGWKTESNETVNPDKISESNDLYAVYEEAETYEVTYYDRENNIIGIEYVPRGYNPTGIDAPVLDGYEFIGWSDELKNKINLETIYDGKLDSDSNSNPEDECVDNVYKLNLYAKYKNIITENENITWSFFSYEYNEEKKEYIMTPIFSDGGYDTISYEKAPDYLEYASSWVEGDIELGYRPDSWGPLVGWIDLDKYDKDQTIQFYSLNEKLPILNKKTHYNLLAIFGKATTINYYDNDKKTLLYSEKVAYGEGSTYKPEAKADGNLQFIKWIDLSTNKEIDMTMIMNLKDGCEINVYAIYASIHFN